MFTKILLAIGSLSLLAIASLMVARSTFASIPDANGVIHGCLANGSYGTTQGALRVIDTAWTFPYGSGSCKPGETPISWNATGTPGAPGTNGTNGTNGATNVVMRSASSGASSTFASATVPCQGAEQVIGGGYDVTLTGTGAVANVFQSQPVAQSVMSDIPASWRVGAENTGDTTTGSIDVMVYVICASP